MIYINQIYTIVLLMLAPLKFTPNNLSERAALSGTSFIFKADTPLRHASFW